MIRHKPKAFLFDLICDMLEMIAYGEDASKIADLLCRRAETLAPEAICSILRVDADGRLRPLAASSLPGDYCRALDGLPTGPLVGSCGTAAFTGKAVEVRDIENDLRWADFKHLALPLGLRACWSMPIKSRDGRVVGTFAFYYREPRGPSNRERQIVERCTHICAVLIENDEHRQRTHELAFVDSLSRLPNRASFDLQLTKTVARNRPFALIFGDLDHLKGVNDTLGHAVGDELIRIAAARLAAAGQHIDVFRLGGDEFAFIVRNCNSEAEMATAAQSLLDLVRLPIEYHGMTLAPTLTSGGVFQGENGYDKNTLYQNADFALYHAKEVNRGGFVPFKAGMRTTITHRLLAVAKVSEALSEQRIVPHYQPLVRLDTAEIVGLEALARIKARNGDFVVAADFERALTDPRLSYDLTSQMLVQVAADIRYWLDLDLPIRHVGINITTADLRKGNIERRITNAFARANVPLKDLILEVNEAVFVNDDTVAGEIKNLRAKGMRVALDDFGTGYASLTHLLQFPVDIIKIDKSFVDRVVSDKSSAVIVQALIDIARQMDIEVVAEGIETKEQAEKLRAMGCMLGQGYHFARPAPADLTAELLRNFAQKQDKSPKDASISAAR